MYQATAMRQIYYYGFDTATTSPATSQLGQFGIAVAVIAFGGLFSVFPMRYLNKIAVASFIWLIVGSAILIICVPAVAPSGPTPGDGYRSNTEFVFRSDPGMLSEATQINGVFTYANLGSRTNSNAFTVCNGLLMAQYLILVFDVPGHMAEETKNASRAVPRAILTSFFLGSLINFGLLLSYLYSVTHVKNASVPGFGSASLRYRRVLLVACSHLRMRHACAFRSHRQLQYQQRRSAAVVHQRVPHHQRGRHGPAAQQRQADQQV